MPCYVADEYKVSVYAWVKMTDECVARDIKVDDIYTTLAYVSV